ncbi:hypothetical protein BT69DRAFT_1280843, partial [Atractiella rhizophila]
WNVGKGTEDYQTLIFTTADSFSVVVSSSVPHIHCFIRFIDLQRVNSLPKVTQTSNSLLVIRDRN